MNGTISRLLILRVSVLSLLVVATACSKGGQAPTPIMTAIVSTPSPFVLPTLTETSTPEATATATEAPAQPETITFKTTDGKDETMPEFTGPQAIEGALRFISENARWVIGDFRTTDWFTMNNPDAVQIGKRLQTLPGFVRGAGGTYADSGTKSSTYTEIVYDKVGSGTVVFYQDRHEQQIKWVYVDGMDSKDFDTKLRNGALIIPKPQSAEAINALPTSAP